MVRQDNGASSAIGTYQYIGPDRVAVLTYQNTTRLTHVGQVMSQNADVGFDDLRRVVNHRWERTLDATMMTVSLGNGALIVGFGHQDASGNPAYDRANNKLIEEKLHDSGNSEVYTYQSDYQLRSFGRGTLDTSKTLIATPTSTPGALQSQTWTLDGLGNWSANTHTTGGTMSTENRTASDYNEIDTVTDTPYGGGAAGTHVLDANGNLTDDGVRTYEYDALNRLRRVYRKSDGLPIGEYTYDAGNRRFRSVVSNGGLDGTASNGTTDFYYDGWRVVEEHDGSNLVTQQYVYGNYLDEVWTLDNRRGGVTVAQLNDGMGGERHFYHGNTLYSVHGLTDETGALREAYQYDAYGRQTVITDVEGGDGLVNFNPMGEADDYRVGAASLLGNPYLYTGQRLDAETKLDYYKNRYYSTDLGRFLQRDPIVGDNNLYRYVGNGPTGKVDALGLDPRTERITKPITSDDVLTEEDIERIKAIGHEKLMNYPHDILGAGYAGVNWDPEVGALARKLHYYLQVRRSEEKTYTPAPIEFTPPSDRLGARASQIELTKEKFLRWYNNERRDLSWTEDLPIPPDRLKFKVNKHYVPLGRGFVYETLDPVLPKGDAVWEWDLVLLIPYQSYHPNATYGIRAVGKNGKSGTQAMYDQEGRLITSGLTLQRGFAESR